MPVGEAAISSAAQDKAAGAGLWALSEELFTIAWNITRAPRDR